MKRLHAHLPAVRLGLAFGLVILTALPASSQRLLREHVGESITLQNGGVWGEFAARTLPMGDLNSDGFDDYALTGNKNRVFSGWYEFRSGDDGRLLAPRFQRDTPGSAFGMNLVPIGDFNGDGRPDLARIDSPSTCEVVDLWTGAFIADLPTAGGPVVGYGNQIVPLGDINFDGFADIAVSSPSPDHIGVHLGPSGVLAQELTTYGAIQIASPGDIDGDGANDLLLGDSFFGVVLAISTADYS